MVHIISQHNIMMIMTDEVLMMMMMISNEKEESKNSYQLDHKKTRSYKTSLLI